MARRNPKTARTADTTPFGRGCTPDEGKLTNEQIAELISTTPHQEDVQRLIRILYARQRYCEEDLLELLITALAKRNGF